MKKHLLIAGITLFPLLAAQAESGVFASIEGGYASLNGLPSQSDVAAVSLENNNIGGRMALGYNHDLSKYFGIGLEAALGKYGDTVYTYADGSNNTIKSSTSEFLAVISYHAIPKLDFFIQAGEARNRMEVYGVNSPAPGARIQPELVVTAAYNFTRNIAATVSYGHTFGTEIEAIGDIGGGAPSVSMALLGLRYTFAVQK